MLVQCAWPCLWPGRYRLEIGAPGALPVHAVAEVVVRAGETTTLPEVDLCQAFRRLELTLLGADGAPLPEPQARAGHVRVIGAEGGPAIVFGIDCGREWTKAFVLATAPAVDLEVIVPGHRLRRLAGVGESCTVQLERGLPVRLDVEGLGALPEELTAEVGLEPAFVSREGTCVSAARGGGMPVPRARVEAPLDGNGVVRFAVVGPGTHHATVTLVRGARREPLDTTTPAAIDVRDADGADDAQLFRIVVAADARQRALSRFAR